MSPTSGKSKPARSTSKKNGSTQAIEALFSRFWDDYSRLNPQAKAIHTLFEEQGWTIVNDHIALRTFGDPRVGVDRLGKVFENLGYIRRGEYEFKEKKLYAAHWEPENEEDLDRLPKVFISELLLKHFSGELQATVDHLIGQVPARTLASDELVLCKRPWKMDYKTYQKLATESEYAGWMAAFGFRANHFTVNVNQVEAVKGVPELNAFLKKHGFKLNASGGEIKGGPDVCLEQSSTLADQVEVEFTDRKARVPACYYEFAKRYPLESGKLFQGFVEKSADKIFESTDRR